MTRPLMIIDDVGGSSSSAQYQMVKYAVEFRNAQVISRSPDAKESFSKPQNFKSPPGNKLFRVAIFQFYSIYQYIFNYSDADLLITNHRGESIFSGIVITMISDPQWIIFSWDSPNGKHIMRKNHKPISLPYLYLEFMFRIAIIGFQRADLTITTDQSDFIKNTSEHNAIIKGGVDCEKLDSILSRTKDDDSSDVVYVGNMYYHRGIDIILDAANSFEDGHMLHLIGPAPITDGNEPKDEYAKNLPRSFTEMVKDHDNVQYHGVLPHEKTLSLICKADIGVCILPYDRGVPHFQTSYPIKIFEYMRGECAVVATKTPATRDLLSENQLVESNNPREVAALVNNLFKDETDLRQIQRANRAKSQQYCWSELWDELDGLVENCIT